MVEYCGNCGLPPEFCEYIADREGCIRWSTANRAGKFANAEEGDEVEDFNKRISRQKRGGRGVGGPRAGRKGQNALPGRVKVSRAARARKKSEAARTFGARFACGASVTGPDEIVLQGDVKDEIMDLIKEKWTQIREDAIEDLGNVKR
ncbi:hypothetical protein AAG570_013947 [Ranatra chinensis]|uniref:SUI1 domain-containing protein n=1 Tax=Ranatra chinensis TaxID=642074 RepID=A0ABD0YDM7_9HEMI